MIPLDEIRAAAERARPYVRRTPLHPLEDGTWLKLELLQPTASFKVRGFLAAALAMPPERLERGLLTVSAGNAALACAYAARALGLPCRVVMFDTAPSPKIDGVRALGATPILKTRPDLLDWMSASGWESEPEAFIHPFAEPAVQAGHGGVGLEIVEELPGVERVLVPVGGGGLVTGVANAVKQCRPGVEVIGVQSDGYPLWVRTFAEGAPPSLTPQTIADGTTAPFDAAQQERLAECVDRWIAVPESSLRAAVAGLATAAKVVAEGAGALAYAALELVQPGPPTVAIVSGGNIAPALLAELLVGRPRS